VEGVTSQHDIAEMMNKNKGTISKWARRALEERRISGSPTKLNPPKDSAKPSQSSIRTHASDDDFDDDEDDL
jgi:transposase